MEKKSIINPKNQAMRSLFFAKYVTKEKNEDFLEGFRWLLSSPRRCSIRRVSKTTPRHIAKVIAVHLNASISWSPPSAMITNAFSNYNHLSRLIRWYMVFSNFLSIFVGYPNAQDANIAFKILWETLGTKLIAWPQ